MPDDLACGKDHPDRRPARPPPLRQTAGEKGPVGINGIGPLDDGGELVKARDSPLAIPFAGDEEEAALG